MGFAPCDQEPCECFRQNGRVGLGAKRIEVAHRLADASAALDGARQFSRSTPWPPPDVRRH
jgi:hypothetical protein